MNLKSKYILKCAFKEEMFGAQTLHVCKRCLCQLILKWVTRSHIIQVYQVMISSSAVVFSQYGNTYGLLPSH